MRISRLMLSLLLAPVASAGVIVVDSNNGPGTDFTSLSAAIAAANDGDVLLLRGSFDGNFVVSGKALSLVADSGATVNVTNSALGAPALQMGSDVAGLQLVRGLNLSTAAGGATPFVVSGSAGSGRHLFVEECTASGDANVGMQLANGAALTLTHCTATGGNGHLVGGLPVPGTSAAVLGAGPTAVYGGFFQGGNGLAAGVYGGLPIAGQDGQNGFELNNTDGSLKLLGSALCIGGLGGDGAAPGGNCLSPGNGGNGVLATFGGNAKVVNLFGLGNFGGTAAPGCGSNGLFGDLLAAKPPAALPTWQNGGPASAIATRVVREGGVASVALQDAGGNHLALLVGFDLGFSTLPTFAGVMVVHPAFTVDLGTVPFPGNFSVSDHVPELGAGVESVTVWVQAVSKDTLGRKVFGEPTAMVLLDSQF